MSIYVANSDRPSGVSSGERKDTAGVCYHNIMEDGSPPEGSGAESRGGDLGAKTPEADEIFLEIAHV